MANDKLTFWQAFKNDFPRDKWYGWFFWGVVVGSLLTRIFG